MEKTPFSGLTVLGPEDSITADNSAFTARDRYEIDRDLKIGVKTHRHDGTAGVASPTVAPSGAIIASGGSIPAGLRLTIGYTLQDASGGETLLSPTETLVTGSPISPPASAPVAVAAYTAGTLDVDTFTYAATFTDSGGGETPIGPSVTLSRDPGFAKAQIELSGLSAGMVVAGASGWRLYRARSGGEYVRLAEGSGDTFTDDGSVAAQCDLHPPTFNTNTTAATNQLQFEIPATFGTGTKEAAWVNLYCSQAGSFAEASLLAQVPVGSAGASPVFSSLELLDAQPPDVNRSYGGANKIDPDTELLDWHWKRPVTGSALLGSGEVGDTRLDTGTGQIFAVLGSAGAVGPKGWTIVGSGGTATGSGGGGGGGGVAALPYRPILVGRRAFSEYLGVSDNYPLGPSAAPLPELRFTSAQAFEENPKFAAFAATTVINASDLGVTGLKTMFKLRVIFSANEKPPGVTFTVRLRTAQWSGEAGELENWPIGTTLASLVCTGIAANGNSVYESEPFELPEEGEVVELMAGYTVPIAAGSVSYLTAELLVANV